MPRRLASFPADVYNFTISRSVILKLQEPEDPENEYNTNSVTISRNGLVDPDDWKREFGQNSAGCLVQCIY